MSYEVGSVVQLKSGGPAMTVTGIIAAKADVPGVQTLCRCMFFLQDKVHEVMIPEPALTTKETST